MPVTAVMMPRVWLGSAMRSGCGRAQAGSEVSRSAPSLHGAAPAGPTRTLMADAPLVLPRKQAATAAVMLLTSVGVMELRHQGVKMRCGTEYSRA